MSKTAKAASPLPCVPPDLSPASLPPDFSSSPPLNGPLLHLHTFKKKLDSHERKRPNGFSGAGERREERLESWEINGFSMPPGEVFHLHSPKEPGKQHIELLLENHQASIKNLIREQQKTALSQTTDQLNTLLKEIEQLGVALHNANDVPRSQQGLQDQSEYKSDNSVHLEPFGFNRIKSDSSVTKEIVEECIGKHLRHQEEQIQQLHTRQLSLFESMLSSSIPWGRQTIPNDVSLDITGTSYSEGPDAVSERTNSSNNPGTIQADSDGPLEAISSLLNFGGQRANKGEEQIRSSLHTAGPSHLRSDIPKNRGGKNIQILLDKASTTLIFASFVCMAISLEVSMTALRNGRTPPNWLVWMDASLAVAFGIELVTKLWVLRWAFFKGKGSYWNMFDIVLLGLQVVDLLFRTANLSFFRVLRWMRAVRAARVLRTLRLVRELRLILASMACSIGSLFWAFLLLLVVLFLCAMVLQETVQTNIEGIPVNQLDPNLIELYGSLISTMLSLFMAITGGADWKDLVEPLRQISVAYLFAFVTFLILVVFGLMNILTAVFVEATSKIADVDADLVIQDNLDAECTAIGRLRKLLLEAETTSKGMVTREAFESKLEDPRFRVQLQMLDLNIYEAKGVFKLLDVQDNGDVDIEELVYALMRLKGSARAMDVASVLYENKRLLAKFAQFVRLTNKNFQELRHAINATRGPRPVGGMSVASTGPNLPLPAINSTSLEMSRLASTGSEKGCSSPSNKEPGLPPILEH